MPAKKTPDTMRIWTEVEKTPVKHTKKVNLGRGFTAIDAQYAVMKATEVLGPVGEGWGYDVQYEIHDTTKHFIAEVTVWHGNKDQSYGPYVSLQPLLLKNGRVDPDCGKKAITDALTKCLSHLGIGADVFLGKYDDNKYMAELRAEQAEKDAAEGKRYSIHPDPDPEQEKAERQMDEAHANTIKEDDL